MRVEGTNPTNPGETTAQPLTGWRRVVVAIMWGEHGLSMREGRGPVATDPNTIGMHRRTGSI